MLIHSRDLSSLVSPCVLSFAFQQEHHSHMRRDVPSLWRKLFIVILLPGIYGWKRISRINKIKMNNARSCAHPSFLPCLHHPVTPDSQSMPMEFLWLLFCSFVAGRSPIISTSFCNIANISIYLRMISTLSHSSADTGFQNLMHHL